MNTLGHRRQGFVKLPADVSKYTPKTITDTTLLWNFQQNYLDICIGTVGGQMSGTAGRMFFCQKGKPLTIS